VAVGVDFGAGELAGADHAAVLAADADRHRAGLVIRPATYLLTVPARTISTTSTIAASVTRRPSMKVD
jgi:hypothetical protein